MNELKTRGAGERDTYQSRVAAWLVACFGTEISTDRKERNHRFLEEALELVQSTGCTQSEAHQLVDYVYGRPVGDPDQEVGGVMVTLAALCSAHAITMKDAAETELARVWAKIEKIRAKQAAKPEHSPLPEHVPKLSQGGTAERELHELKCERQYFEEVKARRKTAEVRLNDRGFRVGDLVVLFSTQGGKYLGPTIVREITHILTSEEEPWLPPGYVMLSFGETP